jgi:hypothetical protein
VKAEAVGTKAISITAASATKRRVRMADAALVGVGDWELSVRRAHDGQGHSGAGHTHRARVRSNARNALSRSPLVDCVRCSVLRWRACLLVFVERRKGRRASQPHPVTGRADGSAKRLLTQPDAEIHRKRREGKEQHNKTHGMVVLWANGVKTTAR